MSSKLLNQRASEDEASRGASPATASSEDSRAMIGLIAAAAASVPPAAVAAAASADSTSTSPTKATKTEACRLVPTWVVCPCQRRPDLADHSEETRE